MDNTESRYPTMTKPALCLVGLIAALYAGGRPYAPGRVHHDERGLSQSTENAILLAGAVAVAGIVVAAITVYVRAKMPTP